MKADPVLLQMKYARVVEALAAKAGISPDDALDFFYHSATYALMREGISDLHCMSDDYLADELMEEMRLNPEERADRMESMSKLTREEFEARIAASPDQ